MSKKFLSFRVDPTRPFNFQDKRKWHTEDGRSYKLLNPDMKEDKRVALAEITTTKAYSAEERLSISGIANANIVDRMQERLDPVGLDVEYYLKNPQLLAHHSYYDPIGQVDAIQVEDDGVKFSGWIGDPSKGELTPMQKEIRSLVAQGIIKTVSVGFIPKKIRAPLYGQNGELEEPCVIEQWELLELSVVAVPCNQNSVFEIRSNSGNIKTESGTDESFNDSAVKESLQALAHKNLVVQSVIFDKATFTENDSIKWVTNYLPKANAEIVLADDDDALELTDGEQVVELSKGVQAVAKVIKKDGDQTPPPAPKAEDGDAQAPMLALMQQLSEGIKKVGELCGSIMSKLEEKPSEDEGGDTPPPPPPKDDEAKAIAARVTKIEGNLEKLIESVSILVKHNQAGK